MTLWSTSKCPPLCDKLLCYLQLCSWIFGFNISMQICVIAYETYQYRILWTYLIYSSQPLSIGWWSIHMQFCICRWETDELISVLSSIFSCISKYWLAHLKAIQPGSELWATWTWILLTYVADHNDQMPMLLIAPCSRCCCMVIIMMSNTFSCWLMLLLWLAMLMFMFMSDLTACPSPFIVIGNHSFSHYYHKYPQLNGI